MYPSSVHPLRFFSLWMLASPAALYANPWGPFGWVELAASIGPVVLGVDRRIHRGPVLAVGFAVIAALCLLDSPNSAAPRLLVGASVFAIGVLLNAWALRRHRDLEADTGNAAGELLVADAFEEFEVKLEREVGRARRHGKSLVILSIAVDESPQAAAGASKPTQAPLPRAAQARALLELEDLLARELRLYSDVVVSRGRVLALVPEVKVEAIDGFVERVRSALDAQLDFAVQIGIGWFPQDAVCVDSLISAADHDRTDSSARRAPDRGLDPEIDRPVALRRESPGR